MENQNKTLFELHNYLDVKGSPEEIIEKIIQDIPDLEDIGYAGYLEKKWLKMTLRRLMIDKEEKNQPYFYNPKNEEEIKLICERVINKCCNYIKEKIYIFLFPTFDKFIIEKMKGVSGYHSWNNTFLIFINFIDGWEKKLEETIVHELAHALSPFAKSEAPIGDWLILEGLAENFKDFILPGNQSDWTRAVSEKEAFRIFDEIKNILEENDFNKYSEIFFGTGKYPLWAGYTIGYYLIRNYLKEKKNIDWNELLRKDPKEILKFFED
jgi:uncharacterized protein YjaZ